MNKKNTRKRAFRFGVILVLVFGVMIGGLQILESTVFHRESELQIDAVSKTITRHGVEYFPRQDITVILTMGIDNKGPMISSGSYRNDGRADALVLVILDHTDESYTLLNVNRDTMVEMPALGIGGKQAGTYYGQLAVSHTYGEGLEDSAENTRDTVSGLLYGVTIDHYVAANMDAIAIVNDAVGGVTVEVTEDFSHTQTAVPKGRVKLTGEQALAYVQTRKDVGNQLNLSRMERQEKYMVGLSDALKASLSESMTFALDLYDQVDEYMVTDCSANVIAGFMERCADYRLKEIVTMKGKNVMGETLYEFYPDERKLDDLVLRLFYAKKK